VTATAPPTAAKSPSKFKDEAVYRLITLSEADVDRQEIIRGDGKSCGKKRARKTLWEEYLGAQKRARHHSPPPPREEEEEEEEVASSVIEQ